MQLTYRDTSLLPYGSIEQAAALLEPYIDHLGRVLTTPGYSGSEDSIKLPSDQSVLDTVQYVAGLRHSEHVRYVLVIGIGGSNLGTKAVYEAMAGPGELGRRDLPKIIFIDTVGSKLYFTLQNILADITSPDELTINIVTKSGTTTEMVANAEIVTDILKEYFPEIERRIIVTTDESSQLWTSASQRQLATLVHQRVGGRYSVFSSVGLLPLLIAGIDIWQLRQGAADMVQQCMSKNPDENPALSSAVVTFLQYQGGANINNTFMFNPELESVGKWYRQLVGESLGKRYNLDGDEVRAGITPMVSVGTTDLHSMLQLYLGGPQDKLTTFVRAGEHHVHVPHERVFGDILPELSGQSNGQIMHNIMRGVKHSMMLNGMPYMQVELEEVNEYELGQYLQFKMIETMFVAQLMQVNAFDQPSVEMYKQATRDLVGE